jgi:predicted DNA-binding transcriptional regulator AlpA
MNTYLNHAEESRLLKEDAAAELMDVSVRTLQAWRARQAGPAYVRVGRNVRYRLRDIRSWIDANTVGGSSAVVR